MNAKLNDENQQDLFNSLNRVERIVTEIKESSLTTKKFLTRKDVAELLGISLGTVHNWTVSGRLKSYGVGRKVYYKSSELENALVELKR